MMASASQQSIIERCVSFECVGDALLGILHMPEESASSIGVIFVVGGPQYRVGSHRQFVLMARSIAAVGYPVLRFDVRGMGDSSGAARSFECLDEDIDAAISLLTRECPQCNSVILVGLCDGASAALMYSPLDSRIAGLVLINPWTRMECVQAETMLKHYYWDRISQADFWRKVLGGRLSLKVALTELFGTIASALQQKNTTCRSNGAQDYLDRMTRGYVNFDGLCLVLLSERDLTAREFETWFKLCVSRHRPGPKGRWSQIRIADADHTFSTNSALQTATAAIISWLSDGPAAQSLERP